MRCPSFFHCKQWLKCWCQNNFVLSMISSNKSSSSVSFLFLLLFVTLVLAILWGIYEELLWVSWLVPLMSCQLNFCNLSEFGLVLSRHLFIFPVIVCNLLLALIFWHTIGSACTAHFNHIFHRFYRALFTNVRLPPNTDSQLYNSYVFHKSQYFSAVSELCIYNMCISAQPFALY